MSALAALLLAQAASAATPTTEPAPMPELEAATAQIEANDAQLFWGFFEGCDPDLVVDLIHPDYRMLHDLVGKPASSAEQFIADSRRNCDSRKPGGPNEGYKNRRLLVPGSRTISRLGDWGMLEEAHHTFQELRTRPEGTYGPEDPGGLTWVQTGGGRYLHVWQWMAEEGRFRLLESLSLEHGPAPEYPPAISR